MTDEPATYTHAQPPAPAFWVVEVIRSHLDYFRTEGVFSRVEDADKMVSELRLDPLVEAAACGQKMTMEAIIDTMLAGTPLRRMARGVGAPLQPGQPDQTR